MFTLFFQVIQQQQQQNEESDLSLASVHPEPIVDFEFEKELLESQEEPVDLTARHVVAEIVEIQVEVHECRHADHTTIDPGEKLMHQESTHELISAELPVAVQPIAVPAEVVEHLKEQIEGSDSEKEHEVVNLK